MKLTLVSNDTMGELLWQHHRNDDDVEEGNGSIASLEDLMNVNLSGC